MFIKNLIFLDVDGVISTPFSGPRAFDPKCLFFLKMIQNIVGKDNLSIVLSSSWKCCSDGMNLVNKALQDKGINQCVGSTPCLTGPRHIEISAWLKNTDMTFSKMAILDDDITASNDDMKDSFFLINPMDGLTGADAKKIVEHLSCSNPNVFLC
jgi:hypothetical protein